jgi:hypothetical protein
MQTMSWLFGKKKTKKKEDARRTTAKKQTVQKGSVTIQQFDEKINMLEKKIQVLEKRAQQEHGQAKVAAKAGNKRVGLRHLKKKKMIEANMSQLEKQMERYETLKLRVEMSLDQSDSLELERDAATAMKGGMTVEEVEDARDQLEDALQTQQEISDVLSEPIGDPLDEVELEDEWDSLADETFDEKINDTSLGTKETATEKKPKMKEPARPDALLDEEDGLAGEEEEEEDDEDLKELEDMMSS